MPSSKEYLDFILDCLSNIDNITYKSMMGEYLIYYNYIIMVKILQEFTIIDCCLKM